MFLTFLGLVQLLLTMSAADDPSSQADEGSKGGASNHHSGGARDEEEAATEENLEDVAADVYDLIKDIRDPEKPNTLEELEVVFENGVKVHHLNGCDDEYMIRIEFTPTVPHCSLATLIGLCIRVKLEKSLPQKHKLDIFITKGTHSTEEDINKQINDKERIAAAMENPNLKALVEKCVAEDDR